MDQYIQKTYYETASLDAKQSLRAGQATDVSMLAYNYVLDMGIITAPILLAIKEFPQLQEIINRGFNGAVDVNLGSQRKGRSKKGTFHDGELDKNPDRDFR
ncbi:hypothetical protein MKX03_018286 [Papaver bracteatum]|nr:hypothetical protein MKX03_018286 [Papaver bracteatum]